MYEAKDKVVFVTGAAKGIGAAVVDTFLQEGAKHVAIIDVDTEAGSELETKLVTKYGRDRVKFIKCNVSKEDELFTTMDTVYKDNGYIDVVVNNAGVIKETTAASRRLAVEVNLLAVINGTIKAIELMHKNKRGHGGTVINVSSASALCQLSPTFFVYAGTKSGVLQFSNCIGKKEFYSSTGVRVLTVCFGGTGTNILQNFESLDEGLHEVMKAMTANFTIQTPQFAGKELVQAYKQGETGSTWLINSKPAQDITETIQKAYQMLAELFIPMHKL